jgi:primary-amine oxidase
MATPQAYTIPSARAEPEISCHPLAPLTATEIEISRDAIKAIYPTNVNLLFKQITLREPAKAVLAPYLDAEARGWPVNPIDRRSFITYYIRNTVCCRPWSKRLTNMLLRINSMKRCTT